MRRRSCSSPPARLAETLRTLLALTLPIPNALACNTGREPPPDSAPEPEGGT